MIFHQDVLDDREGDLDAELLLDVAHPGQVREQAVDRQAEQFAVHRGELRRRLGETDELGGAHRGEVGRVGEQDQPLAAIVFQRALAGGGAGLEVRGRLVETREVHLWSVFHGAFLCVVLRVGISVGHSPGAASEHIQRNFQIAGAVVLGRRQIAGAHVDLHRRQNQGRHAEGGVAALAHGDELFLADAGVDVHVAGALCADGGLVLILLAARCFVVVAHEHAGLVRQGEQLVVDRAIHGMRVAAREVAAGSAVVGHEQGIADEGGVADQVGHAGRGMAGGVDGPGLDVADPERLAVVEQVVELAAVGGELRLGVEQLAEGVLHHGDVVADGQGAAELLLEEVSGAEVIGMNVGLEDPLHAQALFAHMGDEAIGAVVRGAPGGGIVVQYGVNKRALAALRIAHHVAVGEGGRIEEGFDMGIHGTTPLDSSYTHWGM